MEGIYKGKYLIGLYNKPEIAGNDDAVAIFDNCRELAAYMGKAVNATVKIAARRLKARNKDVTIDGKTYEMHFIKYED